MRQSRLSHRPTISPTPTQHRTTTVSTTLHRVSKLNTPTVTSRRRLSSSLFQHADTHSSSSQFDPNVAYSSASLSGNSIVRRFYRTVDMEEEINGTYTVLLNGTPARTSRGNTLTLPSKAYAMACAMEFENQKQYIIPHTMPLVEIAKIAIDRTPSEKSGLVENIVNIFNCDSATHLADPDEEFGLFRAQEKIYKPMIKWVEQEFGVTIESTSSFAGVEQSPECVSIIQSHIESLNPYKFIALDNITALGKSTIVGLCFIHNQINIDQTLRAALLEEYYQAKAAGRELSDTYGTWLQEEQGRHRVATHRQALRLIDYNLAPGNDWHTSYLEMM